MYSTEIGKSLPMTRSSFLLKNILSNRHLCPLYIENCICYLIYIYIYNGMLNEKSQMYPLKLMPNNTLLIHEVFRKTKTGPTVTKIFKSFNADLN